MEEGYPPGDESPPTGGPLPQSEVSYTGYGDDDVGGASMDPMGIAALVCGVLGCALDCCCWPLGIVLGLVGIGLGIFSVIRIKGDPSQYSGAGLAYGGIGAGALALILAVVMLILGAGMQALQMMQGY